MARLLIPIGTVLFVLLVWTLSTWLPALARRHQKKLDAAGAKAARTEQAKFRIDAAAHGLVPAEKLDATRPSAPGPGTAAALAAADAGDWRPAAEFLAAAGTDWSLRAHRLAPLAENAAKDDAWLRAWQQEQPQDPAAALVHAASLVQVAWAVRTGLQAKHVTREQFDVFHRILGDAVTAARAAAELAPEDPCPWIPQLSAAMGLSRSHEEFRALWAEVVKRDPANYDAHASALQYWCAKWNGSHELMHEFADEAARKAPADSMIANLRLRAIFEEGFAAKDQSAWSTPRGQEALDAVLAAVALRPADDFRVGYARHLLAYGLCHSGRHAEAVEQFRLIGGHIGATPWNYTGSPARTFANLRAVSVKAVDQARDAARS